MPDYIPAPDTDFNNWQTNFVTYANANPHAKSDVGSRNRRSM